MMAAATAVATLTLLAVVAQDQAALRAAPSAGAATHAQLWQGDLLEVRGTRLDHLQVYDHRRERAGYVKTSQLRLLGTAEADAPQLLAVLRFLRDAPGAESLGIAYAAAYLKAVPASRLDAEPFDALGVMAERLARRAAVQPTTTATSAHLEVAAQVGVRFNSLEHDGRVQLCYDGEAFARVATMPAATPEQQARAALALTRHDCVDPALRPSQRLALDQARAERLDRLAPAALQQLDEPMRNRLRLRRAGVWSSIAFGQSRTQQAPQAAAQRALDELAAVNKTELGDDEQREYSEAAIRVGAVRGAALAAQPAAAGLQVRLRPGEPGQTCVQLVDGRQRPQAERCTYATVWAASARPSPDGRALALAVQPLDGWTELWVWRQGGEGWTLDILPPATATPGLGYVEWAGWTPGPHRRLLLAREAQSEGRLTRRFEVLGLDTLGTERSASSPQLLAAFGSWADAGWRQHTISLR